MEKLRRVAVVAVVAVVAETNVFKSLLQQWQLGNNGNLATMATWQQWQLGNNGNLATMATWQQWQLFPTFGHVLVANPI